MNGLSIAQATGNVDNADMVAAWVVVGLIIAVACSMAYGVIRSWWLKRTQSIQSRRRQFATSGYQTGINAKPAQSKQVSKPAEYEYILVKPLSNQRAQPSNGYQQQVGERQSVVTPIVQAVNVPFIKRLQVLSLPALAHIFQSTPHIAVLGKTGSGKTKMAETMIRLTDGQIAIIDPKWKMTTPPKWGGLPAATIDDDASYSTIDTMLNSLWIAFRSRIVASKSRDITFEPLFIVWDEINDVIEELPEQAKRLRRLARLAREYNVKLMIFPQSDRVKALGLEGHGDARENFLWLYLGDDARTEARKLVNNKQMSQEDYDEFITEQWPAILEHTGTWYIVDRTEVETINKRPIDHSRAWFPNQSSRSDGAILHVPSVGTREHEQMGTREHAEPLTDMQRKVIIAALNGGAFKSHIAKSFKGRYSDLLAQIEEIAEQESISKAA